jgi:1-acyl-sn-glycerol-3-phosphate acyltransferase
LTVPGLRKFLKLSIVRGWLVLPLALVHAFGYAGVALLWATLLPRSFRRQADRIIRGWGRSMGWILGVRVVQEGREHLPPGGGRILMFNHVSVLDLVVYSSIWPDGGTVVYKQEFHRIPILGKVMRAAGFIPIDRSDREAGRASLDEAGHRIREGGATVVIAPEGTRSRHGRLLPFKKGPFHLALDTRAPVVAAVMTGSTDRLRPGSWVVRPGEVRVRYHAPLPTLEWDAETLEQHLAEVRALFLEDLEDAGGA